MNQRTHRPLCVATVATVLILTGSPVLAAPEWQEAQVAVGQADLSQATISLDDLPDNFEELRLDDRDLALLNNYMNRQPTEAQRREHGIPDDLEVTLNNIFMFGDVKGINHMELLMGGTMLLSEEPTPEVFSVENLRPKIVGLLEKINSAIPGLISFLKNVEELDGANNIGDESAAWTLQARLFGWPVLLDLAIFRKGTIVGFTGIAYFDNTVKTVEVPKIARLLESRIPR